MRKCCGALWLWLSIHHFTQVNHAKKTKIVDTYAVFRMPDVTMSARTHTQRRRSCSTNSFESKIKVDSVFYSQFALCFFANLFYMRCEMHHLVTRSLSLFGVLGRTFASMRLNAAARVVCFFSVFGVFEMRTRVCVPRRRRRRRHCRRS